MITGIGTDIVKTERIEKAVEKLGERFAKRILTPEEFTEFQGVPQPVRYLAKRFAVKEAACKALGTGIAEGVSWQHFTVAHDDKGKPLLKMTEKALEVAQNIGARSWHLSLSDEEEYVVAFVVMEG